MPPLPRSYDRQNAESEAPDGNFPPKFLMISSNSRSLIPTLF
jgi:hypothetical protein